MINVDATATANVADDTLTELIAAPASTKSIVLTMLNFTNTSGTNEYIDVYFGATKVFDHISVIAELGSGNILAGRGALVPAGSSVSFQAETGVATIYANATYVLR